MNTKILIEGENSIGKTQLMLKALGCIPKQGFFDVKDYIYTHKFVQGAFAEWDSQLDYHIYFRKNTYNTALSISENCQKIPHIFFITNFSRKGFYAFLKRIENEKWKTIGIMLPLSSAFIKIYWDLRERSEESLDYPDTVRFVVYEIARSVDEMRISVLESETIHIEEYKRISMKEFFQKTEHINLITLLKEELTKVRKSIRKTQKLFLRNKSKYEGRLAEIQRCQNELTRLDSRINEIEEEIEQKIRGKILKGRSLVEIDDLLEDKGNEINVMKELDLLIGKQKDLLLQKAQYKIPNLPKVKQEMRRYKTLYMKYDHRLRDLYSFGVENYEKVIKYGY